MLDKQEIINAANIIKQGGLVAFPTETVYGLGANALDPLAVAKIFAAKERPSFDPLIVHIASLDSLPLLTRNIDDRVSLLAKAFWPGPLTMVLPKSEAVPDLVTSGLSTVGIRMPNHGIALDLIKYAETPIAAPSANKFGRISPTKVEHVKKQLPTIDCFLDGGPTTVGIESTVITLHDDGFVILRQGIITREDLATVLPESALKIDHQEYISAPGQINSHYSPTKPLYILGTFDQKLEYSKGAFLSFGSTPKEHYKQVEYLTHTGDFIEAAIHLFEKMHLLEEAEVDFIVAEPVPEIGVGIAIMDKLRKAAYKYR
ncbi:MAG: threonylcarbamoyl-AMP synthase [Bacteroidetes bacterium HGW-Bacteroidetes-20]|nr:MAG: threonylcarbamoyl-AMP synthase [Bacteroidetes bacterium HGW-Bacteroidetes-20]